MLAILYRSIFIITYYHCSLNDSFWLLGFSILTDDRFGNSTTLTQTCQGANAIKKRCQGNGSPRLNDEDKPKTAWLTMKTDEIIDVLCCFFPWKLLASPILQHIITHSRIIAKEYDRASTRQRKKSRRG